MLVVLLACIIAAMRVTTSISIRVNNAGNVRRLEFNDFEAGVCLEEFRFGLGSVGRDDEELKIVTAGEILVDYKSLSELKQRDVMAHSWAAEECCMLINI